MKKDKNKNFSLSELEKKDFFEAPESYFKGFPSDLTEKIKRKEEGKAIWANWRYAVGLAAGIALLLTLVLNKPEATRLQPTYVQLIEEVPNPEIAAYLLYSDLGTEELVSEFAATGKSLFPKNDIWTDLELRDDEVEALLNYYEIKKSKSN